MASPGAFAGAGGCAEVSPGGKGGAVMDAEVSLTAWCGCDPTATWMDGRSAAPAEEAVASPDGRTVAALAWLEAPATSG
ncbi:hypothetical protein [Actinomadura oligospora]|uniref:hypothetical protein n=1 Tax=Actinomadura oligospora TaxID=111804 RepID=UPI00047E1AA0|nr:hypothetical protein [Actinomadura oligospora]